MRGRIVRQNPSSFGNSHRCCLHTSRLREDPYRGLANDDLVWDHLIAYAIQHTTLQGQPLKE